LHHILELGDKEVLEGLRINHFSSYMNIWSDRPQSNYYLHATKTPVSNAKLKIPHFYVLEVCEMVSLLMPWFSSQFSLRRRSPP
jgi:hypothetical protein